MKILLNKNALIAVILVLCQQIIVASSTIWLARTIEQVTSDQPFFTPLALFVLSMTVPLLFGLFIGINNRMWILRCYKQLVRAYQQSKFGLISYWRDGSFKEKTNAMFCNESYSFIDETVPFLADFTSLTFNVVFNIIAIVYVIDAWFIGAYAMSLTIVTATTLLTRSKLTAVNSKAQKSKVGFHDQVLRSWDNILIGNRYNFAAWDKQLDQKYFAYVASERRQIQTASIISNLLAIAASLPVLLLVLYLATVYRNNSTYLLVMFSSLMRQVIVLNHLNILIEYLVSFNRYSARLAGINAMLYETKINNGRLRKFITWDKIVIEGQDFNDSASTPESFIEKLKTLPSGRITVRGPNGAGKSTLLQFLKAECQDKTFYLPASSDLEFSKSTQGLSSGQKARLWLNEIATKVDAKIILLDEWDANLDEENKEKLHKKIEQIANTKLVVEVRHR